MNSTSKFLTLLKNRTNHFNPNWVSKRFYPEVRKRFYKNVTVAGSPNSYEINLDHRKLKTPSGKLLQVPNYPLALAVASEWNSVDEKIIPSWMHLTGLSNTVLDNPQKLTKSDIALKALDYLPTDTLLYKDTSVELSSLQKAEWDPILSWFNEKFGLNFEATEGFYPPEVTDETKEILRKYLMSYDMWALSGILYGVESLKSIILAFAVMERRIDPEKAVRLSLLETEYQTSFWGSVEWAHDQDKLELLSRLSAAVLFVHLNSSSYLKKEKIGGNS